MSADRCDIVDSNTCSPGGPFTRCWACGLSVCYACSSIIPYRFLGKLVRPRFCFQCQDERGVGRAAPKEAS